jgi:hypothetical protein
VLGLLGITTVNQTFPHSDGALGGEQVVLDLDDRPDRVDDPRVDDGVDLHGDVVLGDHVLGRHVHGDHLQVDLADAVDAERQHEDQARALGRDSLNWAVTGPQTPGADRSTAVNNGQ